MLAEWKGETMDSGFPGIKGGFAFVASVLDVRVSLPVEISKHVRLQKADDAQISTIKGLLPNGGGLGIAYHYEHDWDEIPPTQTRRGHQTRPLDRKEWKYFVLAWEGSNSHLHDVQTALNLTPPSISCVAQVHTSEAFGLGQRSGVSVEAVAAHFQHQRIPPVTVTIDEGVVDSWRVTYSKVQALQRHKYPAISRAIDLIDQLRRFPSFAHLQVLSHFMVLEMLLTHKPSDKEVGDSLAHQIRTKVALLSRRLPQPLNYSVFAADVSEDKVWTKLYSYRSAVAHGGVPDFEKELSVLRNAETAWSFMATATAMLARYALDEPQLVDSLKQI